MCGIAGYLRLRPENSAPISAGVAKEMLAAIRRRGAEGDGQWRSADNLCWLGHRGLAIIDLHAGDEPMCNEDGTIWTVFNGEIYNYGELRTELEAQGHRFKTRSDTEVLVHGYEQWGLRRLAQRLQGIFAFAVYDAVERPVSVGGDGGGGKRVYWWSDGNALLFASEMKSLLRHPALRDRKVNRAGVAQVLVTRYVSRPATLFEGVSRLPEGCCMAVDVNGSVPAAPLRYWDVRHRSEQVGLEEATEQLDALLKRTVDMQLMSDVPLGVQLSGGVDSSLVVALMETLRREKGDPAPVKTFSVGFDIAEFSELPYARKVAERYGTEHHEITVGFREFAEELPFLAWIYDEPMGEPPGIPTYFMCREAKKHVSVMLCGEGATSNSAATPSTCSTNSPRRSTGCRPGFAMVSCAVSRAACRSKADVCAAWRRSSRSPMLRAALRRGTGASTPSSRLACFPTRCEVKSETAGWPKRSTKSSMPATAAALSIASFTATFIPDWWTTSGPKATG